MTRLARITMPGLPHHVTQRGNRRQPVFFTEDDYRAYLQELQVQGKGVKSSLYTLRFRSR